MLALFAPLVVFAALQVYASAWIEIEICKHATGEKVESIRLEGMRTMGKIWIDPSSVSQMVPLDGIACTILVMSNGEHVSVIGDVKTLHCKVSAGPNCEK